MKTFSSCEPGSLLICPYDPFIYEKGDPDRDYIDDVRFYQTCHAMDGKKASMFHSVEEHLAFQQEIADLLEGTGME